LNSIKQNIPIEKIDFDRENPRIKVALEKYGKNLDDQRIRFALQSATEGSNSFSSYNSLKDSIRSAKGISVPIIVFPKGDRFVCIDGNTRLTVYNDLIDEKAPGDWNTINCLVLENPEQREIETIRVTAHLVGAREWPAYEKARYLHHLRNVQFLDYNELIAICGGNRKIIEQQIDAFHDMNKYYRDVSSDDAFQVDRFSGFVELQKKNIKDAIFKADLDLYDFGKWIRNGQIYKLADVRKLPSVLADEEAKYTFINGGIRSIEDAISIVEENRKKDTKTPVEKTTVAKASMSLLAQALLEKVKTLPREDFVALRDRNYESAEQDIELLNDLTENLLDLLQDV